MFGAHVLDPRRLGIEMPIAVPAEIMSWAPHVMPLLRTVTRKIEVTVIRGAVGVGILLVLTKGSIVRKPSLTTIAIHHLMVEGLKEECVGLSDMRTRSRIEFIRIACACNCVYSSESHESAGRDGRLGVCVTHM